MKKGLILLGILAIGFTACNKDKNGDDNKPKSTSAKIVGKWKGDVLVTKATFPPAPTQTQTDDISYQNIEFKSDGTVVADSLGFDPETDQWQLINDSKIIIDSDTFDIYTITDNNFNLGRTEVIDLGGTGGTFEMTLKLKK